MDAINGAGIDRFLNSLSAVSILTNGSRTTKTGFNDKRVGGDMGAIPATNTNGFVNPNCLIPQLTTQQWFPSIRLNGMRGWSRKGEGGISQGQASQRVTTSSIEPSWAWVCSETWNPSLAVAANTVFKAYRWVSLAKNRSIGICCFHRSKSVTNS